MSALPSKAAMAIADRRVRQEPEAEARWGREKRKEKREKRKEKREKRKEKS
jgi:hypothetical protein